MACRSCGLVSKFNGMTSASILKPGAQRNFSRSARQFRHGGLPVFGETSSAELDAVLSDLRYQIFLPNGYLNKSQHKLVFREEFRSQLENQPVKVTIGSEDIELKHFDQYNLPNTWHLTSRILELLGQSSKVQDWYNVVPNLMYGFQHVGFGMSPAKMEKLIRIANNTGMQEVVMRCIQQVKDTNLSLKYPGVRYEVLWGIHSHAQDFDEEAWSQKATQRAINWMQQLAVQLEDRVHGGGRLNNTLDPRISPAVIGLLLELNAVAAYRRPNILDARNNVRTYAERLMGVLPMWTEDDFADAPPDGRKITFQVILWQALNLAQRVLGAEMPQAEAATKKKQSLEEQIQKNLESDMSTVKPQLFAQRMKVVWEKRIQ